MLVMAQWLITKHFTGLLAMEMLTLLSFFVVRINIQLVLYSSFRNNNSWIPNHGYCLFKSNTIILCLHSQVHEHCIISETTCIHSPPSSFCEKNWLLRSLPFHSPSLGWVRIFSKPCIITVTVFNWSSDDHSHIFYLWLVIPLYVHHPINMLDKILCTCIFLEPGFKIPQDMTQDLINSNFRSLQTLFAHW